MNDTPPAAKIFGLAVPLMLLVSGCSSAAHPRRPAPPAPQPASILLGPARLTVGSVWQLNNPGGGTPRESLTVARVANHHVTLSLYLTGFGTLLSTHVSGTLAAHSSSAKLTGSLSESSVSGSTARHPVTVLIVAKSARLLWVTQTIPDDPTDSFAQMNFTRYAK